MIGGASAVAETVSRIAGIISTVTFRNEETGYFVARVQVSGRRGLVTVVGVAPEINVGELCTAEGRWESTKWGPRLKAQSVRLEPPAEAEGVVKYLGSGAIEGIGPVNARRLVAAFGVDVFAVIETQPERLTTVSGIGPGRARAIVEAYQRKKAVKDLMVFLYQHGITSARAQKICARYLPEFGAQAMLKLRENPYRLCREIWGIGFPTADRFAKSLGVAPDSEFRIHAAIHHVLGEAVGQGSCALPLEGLTSATAELLEIGDEPVEKSLRQEVAAGRLRIAPVRGTECVFPASIYQADSDVARRLHTLMFQVPRELDDDTRAAVAKAESALGITLSPGQRQAVELCLREPVCILTGDPGAGKTTITKIVIQALEHCGKRVKLAAPTGKAAKRLSEVTHRFAATLHRLLEVDRKGQFRRNEDNPIEADVLVVDELSMVDISLMQAMLQALGPDTQLILVGDPNQLPSVGPGKVLGDMIASRQVPVARLTEVFRQAAASAIIQNANLINRGEAPRNGWAKDADFGFIAVDSKDPGRTEKIENLVLTLTRDMWKRGWDPIRDVQVLSPMHRGLLGTQSLNIKLQALLNPSCPDKVAFGDTFFGIGDKVIQRRNNYEREVFNGDVGFIVDINRTDNLVVVSFDDDRHVSYPFRELDELALAYALTVHKSQGSQFPVVIMPLAMQHFMMLRRNLLYTAVTRAQKLMLIVGERRAAHVAAGQDQAEDRHTRLEACLRGDQE